MNFVLKTKEILLLSIIISFFVAHSAYAAPLTYNVDTFISLSSPSISYIIASGSLADALVVNSGNIQVTLSSSTTGSFTVRSTSRDINTSISGTSGTISKSCSAIYVAEIAITQETASATYTIAPESAICSTGHGGGSIQSTAPSPSPASSPAPSPAPAPTSTPPISEDVAITAGLKSQLAELQKTLQSLIALAVSRGVVLSPEITNLSQGGVYSFPKNLSLGMVGDDVKDVQKFLIKTNKGLAAQALKEVGVTGKFGPLTKAAVKEYQESVGIPGANGVFGPKTRAYANALKEAR